MHPDPGDLSQLRLVDISLGNAAADDDEAQRSAGDDVVARYIEGHCCTHAGAGLRGYGPRALAALASDRAILDLVLVATVLGPGVADQSVEVVVVVRVLESQERI